MLDKLIEKAKTRGVDHRMFHLPEQAHELEMAILKKKPKAKAGHISILKGMTQLQKDGPNVALVDHEGSILTSERIVDLMKGPVSNSFDYINYNFSYTMMIVNDNFMIEF